MMMSARERTREVAVLKTIGFGDATLFGVVMLEAGVIAITGAVLGLGGAKLLYKTTHFNGGGFLSLFPGDRTTLALALA
jgi:putative ABC transport system permease protein